MELIKKRIHYIREGKKIFDQFYVDEDYNIPEAKEDVRRIADPFKKTESACDGGTGSRQGKAGR